MITQEYLKECVSYDPDTGFFVWKKRPSRHFKSVRVGNAWNTRYAGTVAGTDKRCKRVFYRTIGIQSSPFPSHRLAWLYVTGEWPEHQIDHIDGDSLNNQFSNLRDVPNQENCRNQRLSSNNTSGRIGVSFHKLTGKWKASIGKNSLGYFSDKEEAVSARRAAEIEYGYHENHGRV